MFRLVGRSGWFDNQFVAVVFCFFAGGVLPGFRQSLQQVRNLRFVVRLSDLVPASWTERLVRQSVCSGCVLLLRWRRPAGLSPIASAGPESAFCRSSFAAPGSGDTKRSGL